MKTVRCALHLCLLFILVSWVRMLAQLHMPATAKNNSGSRSSRFGSESWVRILAILACLHSLGFNLIKDFDFTDNRIPSRTQFLSREALTQLATLVAASLVPDRFQSRKGIRFTFRQSNPLLVDGFFKRRPDSLSLKRGTDSLYNFSC